MMRKVLPFLTALAMCIGYPLPARADISAAAASSSQIGSHTAAEETPDTVWRISMKGRIMTNRGDFLVFLLNQPENMQIGRKDKAQGLVRLPIDEATAFVDSAGNPAKPERFLANQEALVTFRYFWQEGSPTNTARIIDCMQVALQGQVQKVHSYASVDSFGEEILVGTVVSNKGGKLEVFVEHGRVTSLNGDGSSTEYATYGPYTVETKDLPVYGADGKKFDPKLLEQGVRVSLYPGSATWSDTYPPSYFADRIQKIRALGPGEKMFSPAELRSTERVNGTVREVKKEIDDYGSEYYLLTVIPQDGSRLRKRQAEYTMRLWTDSPATAVYDPNGKEATYADVRPGMDLEIRYEGLRIGQASRGLDYCHQINILSYGNG